MCLNIKFYDGTSHCEKTKINTGVLTTPALTGTNCMIEQPNLAIEAGHMFTTNNQKQLNKVYAHYRQPNIGVREIELHSTFLRI